MTHGGGTGQVRAVELTAVEIARLLGRDLPTAEQIAVIEAPLTPGLVVAGAGSGKTETMAARVVWLIANGLVAPEAVLGLTFTRKAAAELADRVHLRLRQLDRARGRTSSGLQLLDRPTIATYNAYAAGLVGDHALRLGYEPDSRLLSEAGQWQLATEIVESWAEDLGTDAALSTVVGAVVALAGALSEHLLAPAEARQRLGELIDTIRDLPYGEKRTGHFAPIRDLLESLAERHRLLDVVAAYQERKRATDSLDFGDQVALAARLARTVPDVGAGERSRYRVVLLDEYQDTSYAQVELLVALFGGGHPVTAVGDPHQSIYGWRGASAAGLARFAQRFPAADGSPADVRYLTTSWRNDRAVLGVANQVAQPLRADGRVSVPELATRPGAGNGVVQVAYASTVEEEAAAVAEFIDTRRRSLGRGSGRVSAAVLCRTRAQFIPIEIALRASGLPVEVVGLGGLLTTPEVVDIVAFLEAAHDPSRGDALMRLLTGPRMNLGVADLHALASWARDLARDLGSRRGRAQTQPDDPPVEPDSVDQRSIVDALDSLPDPGRPAHDGRVLSEAGRERLVALAAALRGVRRLTYLTLPELVVQAEQSLGLDVEVATGAALGRVFGSGVRGAGRANLDAFRDVAATFAQSADTPTLGAFLAWLKTAAVVERGLDAPLHDPDPNAVQVITVHAAKGLEWDVVAVPGLMDGVFPGTAQGTDGPRDTGWLVGLGSLPYPLRGDAADLPSFDVFRAVDGRDLEERRRAFVAACGEHQVAEERRLAYVAFTRARRELLLTGSWWREGTRPRPPSPFLTELVDAGLVQPTRWEPPPVDDTNPRAENAVVAMWPPAEGEETPTRAALRTAARWVRDVSTQAPPVLDDLPPVIARGVDLAHWARLLLAERAAGSAGGGTVELPPHISASGLVRLAQGRAAYALDLRRPVPRRPTQDASRGTRFHLWVERYFSASSLLDPWDLPGADDDLADADLATLQDNFLASVWADRRPLAVEVDIETPVAGIMVRSRIDAVFADDGQPGAVVVVDWKSGRPPTDAQSRAQREVQLAVYRLAWSRWSGTPLDRVGAAFFYVAAGQTVHPGRLWGEAEIAALLQGGPVDPGKADATAGSATSGSSVAVGPPEGG